MARLIEPAQLDDDGKIDWLAAAYVGKVYPSAFVHDNEGTLIMLLARKIVDLEQRIQELEGLSVIQQERIELQQEDWIAQKGWDEWVRAKAAEPIDSL